MKRLDWILLAVIVGVLGVSWGVGTAHAQIAKGQAITRGAGNGAIVQSITVDESRTDASKIMLHMDVLYQQQGGTAALGVDAPILWGDSGSQINIKIATAVREAGVPYGITITNGNVIIPAFSKG